MCYGPKAPELWNQMAASGHLGQRDLLSSDQCVIDNRHYFVLGRIEIPVVGCGEQFVWLAWVSLSQKNFSRACELWDNSGRENEPPYFGWLSSALPYEPSTLNLKVNLHTRPVGERPFVELEPTGHPLAVSNTKVFLLPRSSRLPNVSFTRHPWEHVPADAQRVGAAGGFAHA
jgi:hypothetical protein